jgi:uncharacterized protein
VPYLRSYQHQVTRLVRRPAAAERELPWDATQGLSAELVSGFDAVVHLSGESVAGRWSTKKKRRIRESRLLSTEKLCQALVEADQPPQTFICASAVGYYGDRGNEILTEQSPSGTGFLAQVCREWEAVTLTAANAGIRTVNLRLGIVLSRHGGALKQMLLPFRLGLGGRIGDGRQWWSWIHIDDLVGAVHHILSTKSLAGAVNITAPNPVTNAEFTQALASTLERPAIFPIPGFAAKLAWGEFAKEGLLASARALPNRLETSGFQFRQPEIRLALADAL